MLLFSANLKYAAGAPATADVTPPNLTSPTASKTGSTTGAGNVTTDEGEGILYFVVTQSSTSPSVVNVQAGLDHLGAAADDSGSQAVTATGVQSIITTGLSPNTTYHIHFQQDDEVPNNSTVVTSASFTTDALGVGHNFHLNRRRRRAA